MKLKKIYIRTFRNLSEVEVFCCNRFNVLFGNNAQGKTNFLEAVFLLATIKSFRMAKNTELISWNQADGLIKGWVEKEGVEREIALVIERQGKKVRVDRKAVSRLSEFFGSLNVVLFSTDEMIMIRGVPDMRRRYLDRAVFSGDPAYLALHHQYFKILKNRNALLKSGDCNGLEIWSEKLADAGAGLISMRIDYLDEIAEYVQKYYGAISNDVEKAQLSYHPHLLDRSQLKGDLRSALLTALAKSASEERRTGSTMVGPHRDDVDFLLDGRLLKQHASQGQQRSFVLALKMAEIEYIRNRYGYPPVFLLDDMTAELDRERNRNLMEFLEEHDMQVFITTTSLDNLQFTGNEDCMTFQVMNGNIVQQGKK